MNIKSFTNNEEIFEIPTYTYEFIKLIIKSIGEWIEACKSKLLEEYEKDCRYSNYNIDWAEYLAQSINRMCIDPQYNIYLNEIHITAVPDAKDGIRYLVTFTSKPEVVIVSDSQI